MRLQSADLFTTEPDTSRITVHCEYPDTDMAHTVVMFALSPHYGLLTAREAHDG